MTLIDERRGDDKSTVAFEAGFFDSIGVGANPRL